MEYYVIALITWISSILGLLFAAHAVKQEKTVQKTNALYTLARCIALVFLSTLLIFIQSTLLLTAVTAAMLIVQLVDSIIGIYIRNRMRTLGPLAMAVFHSISLYMIYT